MSDWAIETQALTKQYRQLCAVNELSLHVPRGAIYGFVGRNGAGKTTTIRMLAGLARATGGAARVLEYDPQVDRMQVLERTGFAIDKMLIGSMTGNDLIRFNRGFYSKWSESAAIKYAEMLEVPMKRKFQKLSSGNQTKLGLLLALAQGAELLVLDEPTAGLDPVVTDQLLRLLVEDFASEGRTVFFSSHHLSEVERVADQVAIIHKGRLMLEARLDDVRANFRRVRAAGVALPARGEHVLTMNSSEGVTEYVLKAGADAFAASLRVNGAAVLEVSPMNLSEIFLELMRKEPSDVPVEVLA